MFKNITVFFLTYFPEAVWRPNRPWPVMPIINRFYCDSRIRESSVCKRPIMRPVHDARSHIPCPGFCIDASGSGSNVCVLGCTGLVGQMRTVARACLMVFLVAHLSSATLYFASFPVSSTCSVRASTTDVGRLRPSARSLAGEEKTLQAPTQKDTVFLCIHTFGDPLVLFIRPGSYFSFRALLWCHATRQRFERKSERVIPTWPSTDLS